MTSRTTLKRSVEQGIRDAGAPPSAYTMIPDRFEAIQAALDMAKRGAVVVVAGKGHETEWIVGEQWIPFNDREVVERLFGRDPL